MSENTINMKNIISINERNFIMSYLLNEKIDHASIFISKTYTTLEKKDGDINKLKEYYESIKDDSTTNILVKVALLENNFDKAKTLLWLQDLQNNKEKKAAEYKEKIKNFPESDVENFKYYFKKALDIKVKDLNMNWVDRKAFKNENVTKKVYKKKEKSSEKK